MKILHMIDNYRALCANCGKAGKFEAYTAYTHTHKAFFDGVFQYLYRSPMDALRGYIEQVDFPHFLSQAEENYAQGICDYIVSVAEKTAALLQVDFEFELMLGMEMGNIGGCSVPRADHVPYLYIGIDRALTREFVDIFVPHEMYHMLRCQRAPQTESETLLSRAVEEGLASFVPMWLHKMDWSADTVGKLLGIAPQQGDYLLAHTGQIVAQALQQADTPLTAQIMGEYFTLAAPDAQPALPGYYVGLYFTYLAVKNGVDFHAFSAMPSEEIAHLWRKCYETWKQ